MMLKSLFDAVMERRSRQLIARIGPSLPDEGPILDLGSGTGHFSAMLERERGLDVVTADVSDMHVTGRPPVLIADGILPFDHGSFSAATLIFMLAYPAEPARVLAEAARVTRGPVVLVQTLYSGRVGYAWHRVREFMWTVVAFHMSRRIGYIPRDARFSMQTRRFYTEPDLRKEIGRAGLRIRTKDERPVLPARALVVATWTLVPDA